MVGEAHVRSVRKSDQTRLVALTVLAAVAGLASVGIAALARAGICLHALVGAPRAAPAMSGMMMPGMTMPGGASGACPILLMATAIAAGFSMIAIVTIVLLRPSAGDVAVASARLIVRVRFSRLTALFGAAGALPLAAMLVSDGIAGGATPFLAALFVAAAAASVAALLLATARCILTFARRLVTALVAALRLLMLDANPPATFVQRRVRVAAGVILARRRPSRAPPLRFEAVRAR